MGLFKVGLQGPHLFAAFQADDVFLGNDVLQGDGGLFHRFTGRGFFTRSNLGSRTGFQDAKHVIHLFDFLNYSKTTGNPLLA
jgi:hypothetical protein